MFEIELSSLSYGAFTLPDTDKKMGCIEWCGGVHIAQRQILLQIPIGHCSDYIGLGLSVCVGVGQCEHTISLHTGR